MSNCSDIVEASGPHLYVEVKEQSALMLWHRSFPFASFAAPHLTSSAERWTGSGSNKPNPSVHLSDLFFSQFMARRLVEALSLLRRTWRRKGDGKKKEWKRLPAEVSDSGRRFHNLRRWFDESSGIICDGGLRHVLGLTAVKATNSAQSAAVLQTALNPKGSLLDVTWQLPLERQTAPFWAVLLPRPDGGWRDRRWAGDGASPAPAAPFDLLRGFTCFGLWCHLYMHTYIFYPAGSYNLCLLT